MKFRILSESVVFTGLTTKSDSSELGIEEWMVSRWYLSALVTRGRYIHVCQIVMSGVQSRARFMAFFFVHIGLFSNFDLVLQGIERSPELVDEAYLQVLKAMQGKSTTCVRGWELLLLLACASRYVLWKVCKYKTYITMCSFDRFVLDFQSFYINIMWIIHHEFVPPIWWSSQSWGFNQSPLQSPVVYIATAMWNMLAFTYISDVQLDNVHKYDIDLG